MLRAVSSLTVLLTLAALFVHAQDKPAVSAGDRNIELYLMRRTVADMEPSFAGAATREEWEKRRPQLYQQYMDMLGLWPIPEKTPLNAKVTGTVERDAFKIEKVHFQSKPGLYVTGNLFLPKKVEGKLPAILYVCGHSNKGRDGNKTAYHHHGMWFAANGYVCLVIDTLQLGEIAGLHHGTYRESKWWWHSIGYTPAGVECWNGVRAIDYLVSRPEVDAERIGVTGRSGGGAATIWIAAADQRVKVAVPVSGFSDLEHYVADKVINGHCDCMFLYNTYRWEWTTILGLIAPRPMLFLNSSNDTIFPMPGNERVRVRMNQLYALYQDPKPAKPPKQQHLFEFGVVPGGHTDSLELRLMAYRWFNRFLKNDTSEVSEPAIPRFEGKELRVFPEDKDLPTDALNGKIDETFVPAAKPSLPKNAQDYETWRRGLITKLRERVLVDWPEQASAAQLVAEDEKTGKLVFSTEPGLLVTARRLERPKQAKRLVLLVLRPEDAEDKQPDWAKAVVKEGDAVLLFCPRGCGGLAWTKKSPPNYVERSHVLLGTTVDAGRMLDIQAAARWLHENDDDSLPIVVAGKGDLGVLCAYAALFEPSVNDVVAVEPTRTHRDGPHLLNVLRVLDVSEALGMLAPRRLTLIGARGPEFERVRAIFKAAGVADRLEER
jgi:dienelactone hydrolase